MPLLLSDAPLNFSYGDDAQVHVRCPLCLHPTDRGGTPFAPAECRQHVRVDEEGQTPPIRQRLLLVGVTRLRLLAVDLSRLA